MVNHDGVHQSHCCEKHGCKYMDDDCPVETGRLPALYMCEDCEADAYYKKQKLLKEEEITAISEKFMGPEQFGGHEAMTPERIFDMVGFARAIEDAVWEKVHGRID